MNQQSINPTLAGKRSRRWICIGALAALAANIAAVLLFTATASARDNQPDPAPLYRCVQVSPPAPMTSTPR